MTLLSDVPTRMHKQIDEDLAQRHRKVEGRARELLRRVELGSMVSPAMTENEISKIVLDAAFKVHTKTGPGLLETVVTLAHELRKQGLKVERQVPIPIRDDDLVFDEGFRADLLVEDKVIVELKSVEKVVRVNSKQVLTQLRLSNRKLGLLLNFGEERLKDGIKRIVNGLTDERPPGIVARLLSLFSFLA